MNDPLTFTFTWVRSRRCFLLGIAVACSLACTPQVGAATNAQLQDKSRNDVFALLKHAQDNSADRALDLPKALARINKGLSETRNDPLQRGQWLEALWVYHLLHDDHVNAKAALEESLQLLTAAGAKAELIISITNNLSYSLILLGEVAKAKVHLRRAIVLANQQQNRELLAELYYGIGDAYSKTGEMMVARRYFEAAYEIDVASGDATRISTSDLKLGSIARDTGNYAEANLRHQRALTQFIREKNYRELVTEIELSRDYAVQRNLDEAEKYALRALGDSRALPEQKIDASTLLLRTYNDRRLLNKNGSELKIRAQAIVGELEAMFSNSTSRQQSIFTRPTHRMRFSEQAIRHYALNRDLHSVTSHARTAIRVARRVASDLRATNDDSLAWLTQAQPVLNEYVKALYELDRKQVFGLLETYYDQVVDATTTRHSGVVGRAFEVQAVELFQNYRAAEQSVKELTTAIDNLDPGASAARRNALIQNRNRQMTARDFARDAYLSVYQTPPIGKFSADVDASFSGLPAVPVTDILIRYFVQEDVSFCVALTGKSVEYFSLPPRSELAKIEQQALKALQAPGRVVASQAALSSLARWLPLEFLARHRDARRIVIVPDDAVQRLPFAAINISTATNSYAPLIQRFEIIRTKSASRYYSQKTRNSEPGGKTQAEIVVFADPMEAVAPEVGMHLGALPSARREAASIARIFSTRAVKVFQGRDATNEVLLSPEARSSRVLHIATHGYYNRTAPDIVGLVTATKNDDGSVKEGFLSLTDLFTRPFSSRLVVISGCETMQGTGYNGWGVRSIADGFLAQGSGSVVGALWSISDDATANLMEIFYRELLKNGGNSSTALSAAQRELSNSKRFADPFYWAGMVLESSNRSIDQRVW